MKLELSHTERNALLDTAGRDRRAGCRSQHGYQMGSRGHISAPALSPEDRGFSRLHNRRAVRGRAGEGGGVAARMKQRNGGEIGGN